MKLKLMNDLVAGYDVTKEGVESLLVNLVGGSIVDINDEGKMDSMRIRNFDTFTQCECFMDNLTRQVAGCQLLIPAMLVHVKNHMIKIEKEHCLTTYSCNIF